MSASIRDINEARRRRAARLMPTIDSGEAASLHCELRAIDSMPFQRLVDHYVKCAGDLIDDDELANITGAGARWPRLRQKLLRVGAITYKPGLRLAIPHVTFVDTKESAV